MKLFYVTKKVCGAAALMTMTFFSAQAQGITSDVTWNFGTSSPTAVTPANSSLTVSTVSQNNNNGTTAMLNGSSASSGYTGASGGNNAGTAARVGALNLASGNGSAYFEVTFSSTGSVIINNISFGSRSTGTGPQAYSIRTSKDSYAADIATGDMSGAGTTWALYNNAISNVAVNGAVTLRIYGYGGTGNPSSNTANWRIDDLDIQVTASPTVLPITLSTFSAARTEKNILLNWATASEKNASHFEIERSADASQFTTVGRVNARNNITGASYSYTDISAAAGTVYYRLKNVDRDGTYEYSKIVTVEGHGVQSNARLTANLVSNMLPVSFKGAEGAYELRIVNLAGTLLQRQTVSNAASVQMNIASLAPGFYLLQVAGANGLETFKFVKQ